MLERRQWLGILFSSSILLLSAVPFVHAEKASCQKSDEGVLQCIDLSLDGPLTQSNCWMGHKFVRSSCPTDNLIATCTYEMGVSFAVKTDEGFRPGPAKPLKYQVNCYRDKSGSDTNQLKHCREQCEGLEGSFSAKSAGQPDNEKQNNEKPSTQTAAPSDSTDGSLRLITNINQRTYNAIAKSRERKAQEPTEVGGLAMVGLQMLREYGFTANSVLWKGDFDLIYKTGGFTVKCAAGKMLKLKDGDLDPSMELADTAGAIRLLTETFTPAELAALEYEIMNAKLPQVDDKRKKLLDQAGYDTSQVLHLSAKAEVQ